VVSEALVRHLRLPLTWATAEEVEALLTRGVDAGAHA
jgi:hypothetical protein